MRRASSVIPPAITPTIAPTGVLRAGALVAGVDGATVDNDDSDKVVVETPLS